MGQRSTDRLRTGSSRPVLGSLSPTLDANGNVVQPARKITSTALAANGDARIDYTGGSLSLTWRANGQDYAAFPTAQFIPTIKPVGAFELNQWQTGGAASSLVRNAAGDWSWDRTAGGAETHVFAFSVPTKSETASSGGRLNKVRFFYELGVVNATSVDVVVKSVAFSQGVDPVTADHGGTIVDADYDAAHDTAAERADSTVANGEHVLELTLSAPNYYNAADGFVVVELVVVLANTGTLKVRGAEAEYDYKLPF